MLKENGGAMRAARDSRLRRNAVPRERLPNFVLLGPPKCGTSSLFAWLTAHPSVRGSLRKETFYLMDEGHPLCGSSHFTADGWPGYAEQFPADVARFPVRIEATTHYLYQRTALEALSELEDCRVCVVLREPAARVLSSFQYTQNNLARIAPEVTFDEYVDAVLAGRSIANICPHPASGYVLTRDVAYGEYATHLAPWLDRLGRQRVTVLLFEELVADPRAVLQQLCRELRIDPHFYDQFDFGRKNPTYKVRYPVLHRAARWLRERAPVEVEALGGLRSYYTRLQSGGSTERPDSHASLGRLRAHYAEANAALSEMIGRDLSVWRERPSHVARARGHAVEPKRTDPAPRILMIIPQSPQFRAMGGVRSAAALAIETARAGAVVHVLTSHDTPVTQGLRDAGLPVHVFEALVAPWAPGARPSPWRRAARLADVANSQRYIASLVIEHDIELLHANDRGAFWHSVIPAALLGTPVLDVVRDTQPHLRGLRRWKWKLELLLASRVLVLSEDMARTWSQTTGIPLEKFDVVYSVVDPVRFYPVRDEQRAELRARLGFSPDDKVILYAAAVRPKKQQLPFITRCMPQLLSRQPSAVVAFVGDFAPESDPYARSCHDATAELGLEARARLIGYRDDVADWYRAADLTVLASEKEGLARCMIESLACGTPVVSFDVASAREILDRHACGRVVRQGDYDQLAATAADLLLDAQQREELAEAGRRTASVLFVPERVAFSYLRTALRTARAAKSV